MKEKEFEVGDWVKGDNDGGDIGVVINEEPQDEDGEVIVYFIKSRYQCYIRLDELTKLKPKFDNFEELFEEEKPEETKFKVGDKVRVIEDLCLHWLIIRAGTILVVVDYYDDDCTDKKITIRIRYDNAEIFS